MEVKAIKNDSLGPRKRLTRPLNRVDGLVQVCFTVSKGNYFRNFVMQPLYRRWPLNRGSLSTCFTAEFFSLILLQITEPDTPIMAAMLEWHLLRKREVFDTTESNGKGTGAKRTMLVSLRGVREINLNVISTWDWTAGPWTDTNHVPTGCRQQKWRKIYFIIKEFWRTAGSLSVLEFKWKQLWFTYFFSAFQPDLRYSNDKDA